MFEFLDPDIFGFLQYANFSLLGWKAFAYSQPEQVFMYVSFAIV